MLDQFDAAVFGPTLLGVVRGGGGVLSAPGGAQAGWGYAVVAAVRYPRNDHALPMLTFRMARERGIPVNEASANEVAATGLKAMPDRTSIDRAVLYPTIVDPAWRKALKYLISTQDKQGVWHVGTRQVSPAPVSPVYIETGFTALMIASTYLGTSESVKLLLEHGAEVNPGKETKYNASPLFLAVMAGDREIMALLLAKGADPNSSMTIIGAVRLEPSNSWRTAGGADATLELAPEVLVGHLVVELDLAALHARAK